MVWQGRGSYLWMKGPNAKGLGGEAKKWREKLEKWRSPMHMFSSLGAGFEAAWFSSIFHFENWMTQIKRVGNLRRTSSQVWEMGGGERQ